MSGYVRLDLLGSGCFRLGQVMRGLVRLRQVSTGYFRLGYVRTC